jgi:hypothetical protein
MRVTKYLIDGKLLDNPEDRVCDNDEAGREKLVWEVGDNESTDDIMVKPIGTLERWPCNPSINN